ncbi:hypothetical protein BDK51DRAFT_28555, partial [Blyttiomyces helicus]
AFSSSLNPILRTFAPPTHPIAQIPPQGPKSHLKKSLPRVHLQQAALADIAVTDDDKLLADLEWVHFGKEIGGKGGFLADLALKLNLGVMKAKQRHDPGSNSVCSSSAVKAGVNSEFRKLKTLDQPDQATWSSNCWITIMIAAIPSIPPRTFLACSSDSVTMKNLEMPTLPFAFLNALKAQPPFGLLQFTSAFIDVDKLTELLAAKAPMLRFLEINDHNLAKHTIMSYARPTTSPISSATCRNSRQSAFRA